MYFLKTLDITPPMLKSFVVKEHEDFMENKETNQPSDLNSLEDFINDSIKKHKEKSVQEKHLTPLEKAKKGILRRWNDKTRTSIEDEFKNITEETTQGERLWLKAIDLILDGDNEENKNLLKSAFDEVNVPLLSLTRASVVRYRLTKLNKILIGDNEQVKRILEDAHNKVKYPENRAGL